MAADYLLEFRFEFLWPFWLVLRSIYDSFKYQGLVNFFIQSKYFSTIDVIVAFLLTLCTYRIRSRSCLLYSFANSMAFLCCK